MPKDDRARRCTKGLYCRFYTTDTGSRLSSPSAGYTYSKLELVEEGLPVLR